MSFKDIVLQILSKKESDFSAKKDILASNENLDKITLDNDLKSEKDSYDNLDLLMDKIRHFNDGYSLKTEAEDATSEIDGYVDNREEAKNNKEYQKDMSYQVIPGYAIKAETKQDGSSLPRGNLFVRNIKGDYKISRGLSDDRYSKVAFITKNEAENILQDYLSKYPNAKANIITVYTADEDDVIDKSWYFTPEKAYPYDIWKRQEDLRKKELQDKENMKNIQKRDASKEKQKISQEKPSRASADSAFLDRQNSIKDEEIYQYIINGIHPDWDYEKPMWRWIRPNGEKLVFVLDGIDKADKKDTYVYIRPVFVKKTDSGKRILKYGDLEAIPASTMVNIAHDDLNSDVYANLMRKYSDDPDDWLEEYSATKNKMVSDFNYWYMKNKDALGLDAFDKFDIIRIYQAITKDGYSPQEALKKYEHKIKESLLTEVEKLDVIRDPKRLKGILLDLGIDPDFVDLPAKIEYEDMGDDTEPPFSFNIVAAPNTSVDNIKELYVRDWDKGGKMFPMDLKTIRDILSDPINAEPEVDLWDKASTMNKQRRSLNKGTVGKWQELTKDQVIAALREMEQREEFKNIDLVGKYLAPQSFETRNPLVLKALKELDPERAIKPTKTRTGYNGFSYQIFIPDEDYDKTKPPSVKRTNPYRDMMSAW